MKDEEVLNTVLLKGALTVLILAFARKPQTLNHSQLQPYTPKEAMDIVDTIFDRAKSGLKEK